MLAPDAGRQNSPGTNATCEIETPSAHSRELGRLELVSIDAKVPFLMVIVHGRLELNPMVIVHGRLGPILMVLVHGRLEPILVVIVHGLIRHLKHGRFRIENLFAQNAPQQTPVIASRFQAKKKSTSLYCKLLISNSTQHVSWI
jgi:hypothetical protein